MIARNKKDGRVLAATSLENPSKPLPEIRVGVRIVEDIPSAEDCIDNVPACNVEDSPNHIHAGA
jgi:hypothetical protein